MVYIGLDSICGTAKIGDDIYTYKPHTQFGSTRCKVCIKMSKCTAISEKVQQYQLETADIQERLDRELKTSLQRMIFTLLTYDNTQKITLDALYETFAIECTSQVLACILPQMILNKQITIQDNVVKLLEVHQ